MHTMDRRERERASAPRPTVLSYPCGHTGCGTLLQPTSEPDYLHCSGSGLLEQAAKQLMSSGAPALAQWEVRAALMVEGPAPARPA